MRLVALVAAAQLHVEVAAVVALVVTLTVRRRTGPDTLQVQSPQGKGRELLTFWPLPTHKVMFWPLHTKLF